MTEVMLDLETLSTRPNAVILVIGAIKFNRGEKWKDSCNKKDLEKLDFFYTRIKIDSCVKAGLHIDPSTQKWWEEQNEESKYEALTNDKRVSLKEALKSFKEWFEGNTNLDLLGYLLRAYRRW